MSWYSDREPFDEHEPEFCKWCPGGTSYQSCKRCQELHYEMDREFEEMEDEE